MTVSAKEINSAVNRDSIKFFENSDKLFLRRIKDTADDIFRQKSPVVLISGPSGSGKTTSSHLLKKALGNMGVQAHSVSLDNYFKPLTEKELELLSLGKMDLESPERIDSQLLNEQIEKIIEGERIELPVYDFRTSSRVYKGDFIQRRENEVVIFEGIHALNDSVVTIEDAFKIYVSVRTRIECGGLLLHPSKIRLLRRLIRDNINRGRSAEETLQLFGSVEEGEHKYIMPYKLRSCHDIDTFIPYEVSVYKDFLEKHRMIIKKSAITEDLLKVLDKIDSSDYNMVSDSALIHEFVS